MILVMGDLNSPFIGAQLTVLGVGAFRWSFCIDATSCAVLATAFSAAKGLDPEIAIATTAKAGGSNCSITFDIWSYDYNFLTSLTGCDRTLRL